MLRTEDLLIADVNCDYTDMKKFQNNSFWIVEHAEFNTENQRGEVRLRQMTRDDL